MASCNEGWVLRSDTALIELEIGRRLFTAIILLVTYLFVSLSLNALLYFMQNDTIKSLTPLSWRKKDKEEYVT